MHDSMHLRQRLTCPLSLLCSSMVSCIPPQKLNPTHHPITRITDVDTLYAYLEDARPSTQA